MVAVGEALTVTSISAVYSGGDVFVGTDVNALTGITVTATYSNSQTATVTGYTLSGTIASGLNTITVGYSGCTTTFTVTGVEYALLHQYTYIAGGEDFGDGVIGFHDEIGDYDISTAYTSSSLKGNPADSDAARASWGLYPGDSFTIKLLGVRRTSNYPLAQGVSFQLTAGSGQNTLCLGRGSTNRIYNISQGGATSQSSATPLCIKLYMGPTGGTATTQSSTNTFAAKNGDPQDAVMQYNAETGNVLAYVDGVEFLNFFVDASQKDSVHIDGLAISVANYITNTYAQFSQIQIYKGLTDLA